nr:MAG TPA: hypothetical protein [Caudoviricetes sp.]
MFNTSKILCVILEFLLSIIILLSIHSLLSTIVPVRKTLMYFFLNNISSQELIIIPFNNSLIYF